MICEKKNLMLAFFGRVAGVSIFLFTSPNLHYQTHKDSTISNEISKVHSIPINLWNIFQEHLYTPLSDRVVFPQSSLVQLWSRDHG